MPLSKKGRKVLIQAEPGIDTSKSDNVEIDKEIEYNKDTMNDASKAIEVLSRYFGDEVRKVISDFAASKVATQPSNMQTQKEGTDHELKLLPPQIAAVIGDSTLGRLHHRYAETLRTISLPTNGFTTKQQAQAAARLSSTYHNLRKRQVELGLEPLPKDRRVVEAERLKEAFYRKARKKQAGRAPQRRRPPVKAATLE